MRGTIACITAGMLLGACLPRAHAETYSVETLQSASPFGVSNSCRRPHTSALYDSTVGKTFVCWSGRNMDPVVQAFDHADEQWSAPRIVGAAACSTRWCYHDYPHMVRSHDGRLHVFYALHGTGLRQSTAPQAGGIEGQWRDRTVAEALAPGYPMPVVADNGDLYVFYRHTIASVNRPVYYIKSTDNGETWSAQKPAIEHDPLRTDEYNEIYLGSVTRVHDSSGGERFLFIWTLSGGGGHNKYHYNCYAAYFTPENEHMYGPDGTDLGPAIDAQESDSHCVVEQTRKDYNWAIGHVHSALLTDDDRMICFYLRDKNAQFMMKTATWNGSGFDLTEVGYLGTKNSDGFFGAEKVGSGMFRIYYSRTGEYTVQVMLTRDNGAHWENDGSVEPGAPVDQCQIVQDYRPEVKLLLTEMVEDYEGAGMVWAAGVSEPTAVAGAQSSQPVAPNGRDARGWLLDLRGRRMCVGPRAGTVVVVVQEATTGLLVPLVPPGGRQ